MTVFELLLMAVSLAMDAFAVAVMIGVTQREHTLWSAIKPALFFAGFQIAMPIIGYLLGSVVMRWIESIDHWVVFLMLGFIGGRMVWDALRGGEEAAPDPNSNVKLLALAVATSIDALAVGITFAVVEINVWASCAVIGVVTFVICVAGYYLGKRVGPMLKKSATLLGGVVLIVIGLRILLEHLGVFG